MLIKLTILIIYFVINLSWSSYGLNQIYYAISDINGYISIQSFPQGNVIGKVNYSHSLNTTGWDYLEIQTSKTADSEAQAYAAGLLEGWVTANLIHLYWINTLKNYCDDRNDTCKRLNEYIQKNKEWVMSEVDKKNGSDSYWYQVGLVYKQIDGLHDGYILAKTPEMEELSWDTFFWMNIQEDLYDLSSALNLTKVKHKPFGTGSCSALIKLLPGYKDLLFSHVTWNWYETMLRIQKRYHLRYKINKISNQLVFGQDITFSSYPGFVHSLDDFYITSAGLAVMETTNNIYNKSLWLDVQPIGQIFVFIRSMVANRISRDGTDWAKIFKLHNSGTYNNQWMIINYSLFKPNGTIPKHGLLVVLEQIPGFVERRDLTRHLINQTYWASYNVPAFPNIFNMSGSREMQDRYGRWFSHSDTPRARIFARDQIKVVDEQSMLNLMRSNDFKHDPESECNCTPPYSSENAISSRNDLNDPNGVYPIEALKYSNWGAIDVKITSNKLSQKLQFIAASGPTKGTNDSLGIFCWSKTNFKNISHLGQPDCWDFPAKTYKWNNFVNLRSNISNWFSFVFKYEKYNNAL
ncbi:putative phospholipase B-like 2 [Daktulosphaira vitifoliae]|uniref:putative phospholipase B-like 2 n=1 Tax=Daktulosphaira vitifoliae TaxID=58002 RepID=UPI0021AAA006|nr:putative phospholipase B-like 2 [Daktulosphaira vitifoliae]